jgi:hypothetical protein
VPGERDLGALLAGMTPVLRPQEYVFCTLPPGAEAGELAAFASVREDEGLTIVVEREQARGLTCSAPFRAITLAVHSSLDAIGFIAAVSAALTVAALPANVIAGYHHDHVLVPAERADDALAVLLALAAEA